LFAQKYTGTITGTVTDPQGAVVSGAQVTVTNQGTGETRTATTNASGIYVAPDLSVGAYTVSVKSPNFKEFVSKNVQLDASSTATINAALVVGGTGEQVTVEASTVQVETSSGAVGNVVEGNEVRELPLNGRNFIELTQLAPGVSPIAGFNVVKKGLEGGVDFSVNGNNVTGNLFLVDGVNNNDIGSNRTILVYPSIQAIDEFKILRNSYGPEYGQASGAIINIVTRSGSNQFHGGVFYDGRNDVLNANTYFNDLNGFKKAPLRRNDYGFNIGGPVIKDKLFFFESEEWNKEIRGLSRFAEVPTLAERAGDFSQLKPGTDSNGNPCDPQPLNRATYQLDANGNVVNPGTPMSAVPGGQLSIGGQAMSLSYPAPNLNAPNCINWGENLGSPVPWREDNVRVDYNVTPTWKVMGRFTYDNWSQPYPSTLSYWGDDIYPTIEGGWTQPGRQATVKLTKLIGATAVNDLQVSFAMNRITVAQQGTGANGLTPSQLQEAIDVASPSFFPYSTKFGGIQGTGQPLFWTAINQTQITQGGSGALNSIGPWHNNEQLLIFKDDFSKVFGAHSFKVGFLATNNQKNEEVDNSSGQNGGYWSTTSANAVASCPAGNPNCTPDQEIGNPVGATGNGVFDLLWNQSTWGWGEPNTTSFALMRWHDYEFYAGDSWKIRRNVTVEYGARYSFLRNTFTADDHYGNWQPGSYNAAIGGASPCNGELLLKVGIDQCATLAANLGIPNSGAVLGPNRSLKPQNNHMIAPRIGVAWDVRGDGKTSIRAGFGQFYLRDAVGPLEGGTNVAPFVVSVGATRGLDVAPAPGSLTASGTPSRSMALNDTNPYTSQWNLTVERELAPNTKLEVAYVGNRGIHLRDFSDQNAVPLADRVAFATSNSSGLRPFGTGSWSSIYQEQWTAFSNYNALQALFRTRVKAVDAQFAYTWSKSLSNTDISDSSGGPSQGNAYLDAFKPRLDYGPTTVNRPHMLVGNIVYNAPALVGQSALVRNTLGSWELSSILTYASGPSLTVYAGGVGAPGGLTGSGTGQGNDRPNLVPGQSCRASGGSNKLQWFNPNKFTLNGYVLGQDPTSPRGVCLGPGNAQTDFSVGKNFKITERVAAKFSMDFFNLFNKTQFIATSISTSLSNGATVLGNNTLQWDQSQVQGNFGQNTAAKDPRQIQYNMRITF
jgi:hypothetical protein